MLSAALPARSQAPAPKPELPAEARQIGEDRYQIGKVTVDLKAKTAVCAGKVNMQRGTIEYFATSGGKLHEALLNVDARPLHLQVALILLGLEPQGGLRHQGDTQVPKGPRVELWVSWQRAGRPVKARAEELCWDLVRKAPMQTGAWTFSGSAVNADGFVADQELLLVGTYRDPAAVINNRLPTGSDDSVYKVNERIVPPVGTPVTLTVTPAPLRPGEGA
jgi:hypothetical protein